MTEQELIMACCFKLIKVCKETDADKLKIKQENVTFDGESLGDWEISVRRVSK